MFVHDHHNINQKSIFFWCFCLSHDLSLIFRPYSPLLNPQKKLFDFPKKTKQHKIFVLWFLFFFVGKRKKNTVVISSVRVEEDRRRRRRRRRRKRRWIVLYPAVKQCISLSSMIPLCSVNRFVIFILFYKKKICDPFRSF